MAQKDHPGGLYGCIGGHKMAAGRHVGSVTFAHCDSQRNLSTLAVGQVARAAGEENPARRSRRVQPDVAAAGPQT